MIDVNGHITIPKNIQSKNDLDYTFLRELGIEHLQKLSGKLWTDYNIHDPGVTILEVLCYAITDLGYRLSLPTSDLLAGKDAHQQFLTAIHVLPCGPISPTDYRKLFIDIKGVENAWLETADCLMHLKCDKDENELHEANINGLYKLIIDIEDATDFETKKRVLDTYHNNRNLCEDLVEICEVDTYEVQICTKIELEKEADEELIDAKLRLVIEEYLSPTIEFYNLSQMLDKQYSPDEIFDGPVLCNGFIEDKTLEKAKLRTEVRVSDIVHIIMDMDGVKNVSEIQVNGCNKTDVPEIGTNRWRVCIPPGKKPVMCEKSMFKYMKGLLPIGINTSKRDEYLDELKKQKKIEKSKIKTTDLDFPIGTAYDLSEYSTIQEHFPETYGISSIGLKSSESIARKSQVKQLQAYLLQFEQILATYFSELNQVKEILAMDSDMRQTYFFKAVTDIPGISDLIQGDYNDLINQLNSSNDPTGLNTLEKTYQRRNKLFDHLLARFEERFGEYAYILKSLENDEVSFADLKEEIIDSKHNFLKNYPNINYSRAQALNYYKPSYKTQKPDASLSPCEKVKNKMALPIGDNGIWNTENVSGFEKKIALLTGLKSFNRRNLMTDSETADEGFYLIEHSLLLPGKELQLVNIEYYEEKDDDNIVEYRWRMLDKKGKVLLSSSKHYHDIKDAKSEVNTVIHLALSIDNFQTFTAKNGKLYFNLINPQEDTSSESYIVARSQKYFPTKSQLNKYKLIVQKGLEQINELHNARMKFCCSKAEEAHLDPYSFRVTIVFPGFTSRFSKIPFRRFIDDLIRRELPAHIVPKICFVGKTDLLELQRKWKKFLECKISNGSVEALTQATQALIDVLQRLNNIYHNGYLHDCDNDQLENESKIILGQSNLGKLKS